MADLESHATYEELAELEREFEDVDSQIRTYSLHFNPTLLTGLVAQQYVLSQPLYAKRANLIERIPNFWTLALEVAPPEIDNFIQPSDAAVFAGCLRTIEVSRHEIKSASEYGEPRNFEVVFGFAQNEWFEDREVRKMFWRRRAKDGWLGLVSEPVRLRWKKGMDLTGGLLDKACDLFKVQGSDRLKHEDEEKRKEYKALLNMVEKSTQGAQSFFTWFGYRGRWITAEESEEATKAEEDKTQKTSDEDKMEEDIDIDDTEEIEDKVEIFPEGETLAMALSEDLWPHALKYFSESTLSSSHNANRNSRSTRTGRPVGCRFRRRRRRR